MAHEPEAIDLSAPLPDAVKARIARSGRTALIVGVVALVGCALTGFLSPTHFFRAYLLAYVFVLGIVLGSLAIVMVHHLSGGAWGLVIRRVLESATRTLPLMAVLFLPIALGITYLYPWARAEEVAASELLRHKQPYLNVPFFLARAAFYFASWLTVAYFLNRWSLEQDRASSGPLDRRFRLLAAPGLLLYGLTVTFAAIDWIMSLVPEWFSTIFGVLIMGGQALSAMAFVVAVVFLLSRHRPLANVMTPALFHDLGKLLFAFVMLWAYFSFSQFLIIWAANLPEEIPWYLRRMGGMWGGVAVAVVVGHFVLPFMVLLSRDVKRNAAVLARVAMFLIAMRFVDLFWMISPAFPDASPAFYLVDLLAVAGIGGVWLWGFSRQLTQRPLIPFNDPYLGEALGHAGH